jgi:ABC-type branched-subunit amino acid transport system ATPase component
MSGNGDGDARPPGARGDASGHVLRTDDVVKTFRGVQALRGVTLQVAQGEIVGLIGPNGSGKTTLLNVVSGVLMPTGGRIFVGERDVTRLKSDKVTHLGVGRTFQNIRLFGHLSVRENVEVGAVSGRRKQGVDHQADIDAALERFALGNIAEAPAHSLPYGAQRRVEIARALAPRPDFLLLDEPAAGMNEAESDELLEIILGVRRDFRCGILIVDHDLRLIMRLCERIHVLAEGRTLAEGTPQEVRHNAEVIDVFLGDTVIDQM